MKDHEKSIKICANTAQITVDASWPKLQQGTPTLGKRSMKDRLICPSDLDPDKMDAYLELCRFVQRDASADCNGIMLRGSMMSEENAINLLSEYDYNYDLATFHILNA